MTFIDFCAGIGAGRLGLEALGMNCLGFSEIDTHAENTYRTIFGNEEVNFGNLMNINIDSLPNFDFMIAGFPCQSFSILGKQLGLNDIRGQVIYGLLNILKQKQVKYFIFENVKGLVSHDNGKTLDKIVNLLNNAGYHVWYKVLNSNDFGVPHSRERVYIVGMLDDLAKWFDYEFPRPVQLESIADYLIDNDDKNLFNYELNEIFYKYLNNKYNIGKHKLDQLLQEDLLILDTRQSDLRLYNKTMPTLRRGRHGILYVKNGKLRKLSGYESLMLQGFPKDLAQKCKYQISDTHLLNQTGNAMTVSVIQEVANKLLEYIKH
jgi:DNA (cytosine-5)-methyltransferase 1